MNSILIKRGVIIMFKKIERLTIYIKQFIAHIKTFKYFDEDNFDYVADILAHRKRRAEKLEWAKKIMLEAEAKESIRVEKKS